MPLCPLGGPCTGGPCTLPLRSIDPAAHGESADYVVCQPGQPLILTHVLSVSLSELASELRPPLRRPPPAPVRRRHLRLYQAPG